MTFTRIALGLALVWCGWANAHPLAPALLELRETGTDAYEVLWRTSITRAERADLRPMLPEHCVETQPPRLDLAPDALTRRWRVHCAGGITGRTLAVSGLHGSGINVIVSIASPGQQPTTALLDAARPSYEIAAPAQAPSVFGAYLALGVEHLLLGLDHVLFVAGLVLLLARRMRPLIVAITAFTLGHSITLTLATLGWVAVRSAVMEFGIALSILVLAVELARGRPSFIARFPGTAAGGFGLLHGLGFAGALAEVGLPTDAIPLALFAFNLGIELGQLAVIAALLGVAALARRVPQLPPTPARTIPVYAIGSLAAYWCFERATWLI